MWHSVSIHQTLALCHITRCHCIQSTTKCFLCCCDILLCRCEHKATALRISTTCILKQKHLILRAAAHETTTNWIWNKTLSTSILPHHFDSQSTSSLSASLFRNGVGMFSLPTHILSCCWLSINTMSSLSCNLKLHSGIFAFSRWTRQQLTNMHWAVLSPRVIRKV